VQRFYEVFVLSLLACLRLSGASACISGNSLATYEALGPTGCYVGPLLVEDFVFSVVSTSGGATPVADTSITVTTQSLGDTYGLVFGSSGFNVSSGQSVSYLIGFTWDPSGDIRNASDILDPGAADILTDLCVGAAFSGVSCSGTPLTLQVFQPSQLFDSVSFSPVSVVGVLDNISLDGSGGSASFESIENDVTVPEPAAGALAAGGLLGWFALRGRRRKAAQVVLQSR
jgi:hypothetical protein